MTSLVYKRALPLKAGPGSFKRVLGGQRSLAHEWHRQAYQRPSNVRGVLYRPHVVGGILTEVIVQREIDTGPMVGTDNPQSASATCLLHIGPGPGNTGPFLPEVEHQARAREWFGRGPGAAEVVSWTKAVTTADEEEENGKHACSAHRKAPRNGAVVESVVLIYTSVAE